MQAERNCKAYPPFVERSAGDSEYNRLELEKLEFPNTCVLPIYVKQERYNVAPSPYVMDTFESDTTYFLFVGRIAPNKKLEDVMKLLFFYKKYINLWFASFLLGKQMWCRRTPLRLRICADSLD